MLKLLSVLLFLAIAVSCNHKMTVVKARQEKLGSHDSEYKSETNLPDPAYDSCLNDGLILFRQGDFERARFLFEQAISADITGWQAHYYLGLVFDRKQEHALAQKCLNTSLTYAPDDKRARSRIYLAMAESWEKQGKLGQAKLNYITALNLCPDSPPATAGLERIERIHRQSNR